MGQEVKYGAYLILPFKYDEDGVDITKLEAACPRMTITTMDLNENIKAMLNRTGEMNIGSVHQVERKLLKDQLSAGNDFSGCVVRSEGEEYEFDILPSYLYLFHTRISFLCLGLSFSDMEALKAICNPGFSENDASFFWKNRAGQMKRFSMGQWIENFMAKFNMRKFFDGEASPLLESYTYILSLVPKPFKTLDELRKVTFHLHQMMPIDTVIEDDSEEDIRYVYAVKNQELDSYRWGCCVASQTISYVFADPDMNLEAEMETQAQDGMPIVLLSLYEKYTCLRFTELISTADLKQAKYLKNLKSLMLKFQAFGTVTPANISRWNNVKQIYAYMQEVNDVKTAVEDISSKLSILTERQQELERNRNETVINIITIFGIVSILASVLSIIQILSDGNPLIWTFTILTSLSLAAVFIIALKFKK